MNTDIEDLLRQGMLRYTADLHAPAGMVREARRRRGRRLARRSVTAGAALAACAAAVVAVVVVSAGLPGAQQKSPSPAQTIDTAYVAKRVASALSAAGPAEIAQMTVTSSRPGGGTTTAREWSYGDQWRSVEYSSTGQPVFEEGDASSTYTLVDYSTRTWARQRGVAGQAGPAPRQAGCVRGAAALSLLFRPGLSGGSPSASVVRLLRTAISCGTLAKAGRQRVDGIEATRLTSRSGSLISETVWISPATYLPVRVVIRPAPGSPVSPQAADITWLKPTAQNQAALTVLIPAGFRQVPFGPAVRPASP
jgi:hypothetical protein